MSGCALSWTYPDIVSSYVLAKESAMPNLLQLDACARSRSFSRSLGPAAS